jgi:uncharacterized protein (TIGR00730 family)
MSNPFRFFNSSPEVIRLVVMMYVRYPLSLRNVEDLLAERGIDISHENMHERKQAMFERADVFVALPGGVGTLEELVEQMTWAQLERHAKPILLVNLNGFWRPLLALFAQMNEQGFIRRGFELRYLVAERIEDVVPMLRAAEERRRSANDQADKATPTLF